MKTIFILTYYILLTTRVASDANIVQKAQETHTSYQAALDSYNQTYKTAYIMQPDIKKVTVVDTLALQSGINRVEVNYNDSIHNAKDE